MKTAQATSNRESAPPESLANQVRKAIIWRSGSQIVAQMLVWASTFVVIRVLDPRDYGLFAMGQVVLTLLNMLNGYGLASGIIRKPEVTRAELRQLFGMLIVMNVALALAQIIAAPIVAAYYRQAEVAHLLRVQALLYLATPFIAFSYALLSRAMDFKQQAKVNFVSSLLAAATAISGALLGLGVWTLVLAPLVLFWTRALGMMIAARAWMWPSFDFRGAGGFARYGGILAAGQLFWFVQSQADVFIAGRHFDPHMLGIYTTALFLTQIFQNKVVPPLNEVAFSAYARIQHEPGAVGRALLKSSSAIMAAALPFYMGVAVTAEPLVLFALGPKWADAIPVVHLLALAMPFMTLYVLLPPASDAIGKPGIGVRASMVGSVLLPIAFLVGVQWGLKGMAGAWIVAYPIMLGVVAYRALPAVGLSFRAMADAIAPSALAAIGMALIVGLVDRALPPLSPAPRLILLGATGACIYGSWLLIFSRGTLVALRDLVRRK